MCLLEYLGRKGRVGGEGVELGRGGGGGGGELRFIFKFFMFFL